MCQVRLVPIGRDQEFARNDAGALVDQLVERVLAVGARCAPDDGARVIGRRGAVHQGRLAVGFHFKLLEVIGQLPQPLVIGQHSAGGIAADLIMPDADQGQQHGHVLVRGGGAEVTVHRLPAAQKRIKGAWANGDHQRQADGPPDGIAPTDPVFEAKDLIRIDTEIAGLVLRCAQGGKLLCRIAVILCHPRACGTGVGHRLDRGEGLGSDDHQCGFRIKPAERVRDMRPVDIRHEVAARPVMIGRERLHRHRGPKIGPADTDIHHIRNVAAADLIRETAHPVERIMNAGHHIRPIHHHRPAIKIAQRRVQYRAVFGLVDLFACEHRIATRGHVRGIDQRQQRIHRIAVKVGFGEVEQHVAGLRAERLGAIGCVEQRQDRAVLHRRLHTDQIIKMRHGAQCTVASFNTAPMGA